MKTTTHSAAKTAAFGKKLAAQLKPGDLLLLRGDLGAGKTTFVQGIAAGLRAGLMPNSPSFTIMLEYLFEGGIFRHLDLYRLNNPEMDADTLGLPELMTDEKAITAVEWPENLKKRWERKGRTIEIIFSYGQNKNQRVVDVKI